MLSAQVHAMLTMDDATLKKYLQKECKHKDEILQRIATMRNEALANKEQSRFNELSWLYNVVKGTEVLCPD
jgi:ferritin